MHQKQQPDRGTSSAIRRERAERRPYARPVLTEYGSIARLTHTGGSTAKEFGVPKMKINCL